VFIKVVLSAFLKKNGFVITFLVKLSKTFTKCYNVKNSLWVCYEASRTDSDVRKVTQMVRII